ncbi:MAG: ATP-binding protein [Burkholderiaceae bacterium]
MLHSLQRHLPWFAGWLLASLAGATWIVQGELGRVRESLEAQARTAHRLLSQRAGQQEAVLATLASARGASDTPRADQRPPAAYPQILSVQSRTSDGLWQQPMLAGAEAESHKLRRAVMTDVILDKGRYQLLLAADPASYAVLIDVRSMVPWNEWPMHADSSPVQLALEYGGQSFTLQSGRADAGNTWSFAFSELLASESQPLRLVARRQLSWLELPWSLMFSWTLLIAVVLLVVRALLRQRTDRRRAEDLLRLGQVERQSTLGELAGGIAQELDPTLGQMLANALAAQRVLGEDPPDLLTAQLAVQEAVRQAQLATDVVRRLRHAVSQPDMGAHIQVLDPLAAARKALHLLEPELRRRSVEAELVLSGPALRVRADPAGLEQILYNLLMNALQALDHVQISDRNLVLTVQAGDKYGQISVSDSGPGITGEVLAHVFKPFFSTRDGALGLGLTHSESLARGMGGSLEAFNRAPRGAEFCLSLPLASLQ